MDSKLFKAFLRKLHTRNIVGWLEEERIGKPLYDELFARVTAGGLSPHQTANALVVLFRLRMLGDCKALFEVVLAACLHDAARARNQAVRLAIGMMRWQRWAPDYCNEDSKARLQASAAMGLDPTANGLVRRLLEEGTAALELK